MAASKPTPAGASVGGSVDTQQGAQASGQGQAPKPEAKESGKPDLIVKVGIGPGFRGDNDGDIFATGKFGDDWNHTHTQFKLAPVWQMNNSTKFRVKGGFEIAYQNIKGNERSPGSIHMGELGLILDLQNTDAFLGINGGKVQFLPFFDLGVHFALAGGDTPLNSIRIFPTFGPGMTADLSVGILGVNIPKVMQVNLAVQPGMYWYHNTKDAGENVGGWSIMPQLVFRGPVDRKPDVRVTDRVIEKEVCKNLQAEADRYWANTKDLRDKNAKLEQKLADIREYLETRPEDPMSVAQIWKASWVGHIESELGTAAPDKKAEIQKAIKEAQATKRSETKNILKKVEGLPETTIDAAIASADAEFPPNYDFYIHNLKQAPDVSKTRPIINVKDCKIGQDQVDKLEQDYLIYRDNNRYLTQKIQDIKIVVGKEGKVDPILFLTLLDVNQPNFGTNRSRPGDITDLTAYIGSAQKPLDAKDPGLLKILNKNIQNRGERTKIFEQAEFELEELKELANWMLGKGGLKSGKEMEVEISGGDPKAVDGKVDESNPKIKMLRELQKTYKIRVEGHTDLRGKPEDNMTLSQRRSETIRLILIGFGVAPERIEAIGYGQTRPKAKEVGSNQAIQTARVKNRRTEYRIAGSSKPTGVSVEEWGGAGAVEEKGRHVPDSDLGDKADTTDPIKKPKEKKVPETKPGETKVPETKPGEKKPSPWDVKPKPK